MTQATTSSGHPKAIRTTRRGEVQRWTRTLIPTTREAPADAETLSHILLVRAGYIRRLGAGIYDYLPLAWRSIRKISDIVRAEMDAAGAGELHLPVLHPIEAYKPTGRDEEYGDLLFRLTDRHGRVQALGPTHEEVITELVKNSLTSYRQFPLNLYQIQTKFRDEFRPRAGLLRCREFIMKDAYSFHLTVEGPGGLNEAYDAMYSAYVNAFTRCGLDFTVVEAESGPIGGSASHEFMVNCATGEDMILVCPETGYAANVEKCEIGDRAWSFDGEPAADLEKVHTPGMPGIEGVAEHLGVTPDRMLKTIVYKVIGPGADATSDTEVPDWVLGIVRGDHEVNEGKLKRHSGCTLALADEKEARAAGFAIGYVSPRMVTAARVLAIVDPDATSGTADWATGADEHDHHVRHFNWKREMGAALDDASRLRVADLRNALPGDPSPRAQSATLIEQRGIEVGHIFKLGTKYADAAGFTVLDADQKRRQVVMGCYGLGVSRTLAACAEMSADDNGLNFPAAIAPYHVLITLMKPEDESHAGVANDLAEQLAQQGVDVLIDDRHERPGVKFKDADLIGLPIRLTIGDKALAQDSVEFKQRTDDGKGDMVPIADAAQRCVSVLNDEG